MRSPAPLPDTGRWAFRRQADSRPRSELATRRVAQGLRQTDLAKRVGVSSNMIGLIEAGTTTSPRLDTAVRIARAVGVDDLNLLPVIFPGADAPQDTERPAIITPGAPTTSAEQGRRREG